MHAPLHEGEIGCHTPPSFRKFNARLPASDLPLAHQTPYLEIN
jgi:hypothetical protein